MCATQQRAPTARVGLGFPLLDPGREAGALELRLQAWPVLTGANLRSGLPAVRVPTRETREAEPAPLALA